MTELETLKPNSQFGPYYLERLIAVGGMAEIYLARTKGVAGLEKRVVLKVIQPELAGNHQLVEMLVDEAKVAVGLNHPNIAQVFDLGKVGNRYFLTMEFIDGTDFFQLLKRLTELSQDLPIPLGLFVVQKALFALDYAHTRKDAQGNPLKIIHRDISPQNVLVSRSGAVKLVDFGIAKAANLNRRTLAGVIKGKLIYMSPEQAWGKGIDQRTDLFSAGIVLYEALTMGSLYLEKDPVKLLSMVRNASIAPPSSRRREIPKAVDELVMQALWPDPDRRYQTAREFAEAISSYLNTLPSPVGEHELSAQVRKVLDGGVAGAAAASQPARGDPSGAAQKSEPAEQPLDQMQRADFVPAAHGVIFSADELLNSVLSEPGTVRRGEQSAANDNDSVDTTSRRGDVRPGTPAADSAREPRPLVGKLLLLDRPDTGAILVGQRFLIGRAGDLRLGDARVSRRHAIIERAGDAYTVQDLGSSNGTYLNDVRVQQPRRMAHDDVVRVGPFRMRFIIEPLRGDEPKVGMSGDPDALQPSAMGAELAQSLPLIPALSASAAQDSAADALTTLALDDEATLCFSVGTERVSMPVGTELVLGHRVELGQSALSAASATVTMRAGAYWIEPTGGAPGISLNGKPITSSTKLNAGDRLKLGVVEVDFVMVAWTP